MRLFWDSCISGAILEDGFFAKFVMWFSLVLIEMICTKNVSDFPSFKQDFISGGSRSERCDTVSNLISKGCLIDSIEYPSVNVIPTENEINTQVTPGEVLVQLRPGLMIFK